jgi:hypothetical protein
MALDDRILMHAGRLLESEGLPVAGSHPVLGEGLPSPG